MSSYSAEAAARMFPRFLNDAREMEGLLRGSHSDRLIFESMDRLGLHSQITNEDPAGYDQIPSYQDKVAVFIVKHYSPMLRELSLSGDMDRLGLRAKAVELFHVLHRLHCLYTKTQHTEGFWEFWDKGDPQTGMMFVVDNHGDLAAAKMIADGPPTGTAGTAKTAPPSLPPTVPPSSLPPTATTTPPTPERDPEYPNIRPGKHNKAAFERVPTCSLPGCFSSLDLKKCSKCLSARYCSREHQAEAWKTGHSQLCKIISQENLTLSIPKTFKFSPQDFAIRLFPTDDIVNAHQHSSVLNEVGSHKNKYFTKRWVAMKRDQRCDNAITLIQVASTPLRIVPEGYGTSRVLGTAIVSGNMIGGKGGPEGLGGGGLISQMAYMMGTGCSARSFYSTLVGSPVPPFFEPLV